MASEHFKVDGLKEALAAIEERDPFKKVAILRKGARKAMEPVKQDMIAGAHEQSGALKESIDLQARTGSRSDKARVLTIRCGPVRKKGRGKGGESLGRINQKAGAQEFGTSAHGQEADPFIRPALEKNKHRVLEDFKRSIKEMLEKRKSK